MKPYFVKISDYFVISNHSINSTLENTRNSGARLSNLDNKRSFEANVNL